jgi:hypothetical protein
MAGTIQTAWSDAEREIFDWLVALYSATEDTDAFLGKLPKNLDLSQSRIFAFMLSGGNDRLDDFNIDEPGGCGEWMRNGSIRGVFKTRALAQTFDGELRAGLPLPSGTLSGITRFVWTQEALLQSNIYKLKEDQTEGGEKVIWLYELPVQAIFTVQP